MMELIQITIYKSIVSKIQNIFFENGIKRNEFMLDSRRVHGGLMPGGLVFSEVLLGKSYVTELGM